MQYGFAFEKQGVEPGAELLSRKGRSEARRDVRKTDLLKVYTVYKGSKHCQEKKADRMTVAKSVNIRGRVRSTRLRPRLLFGDGENVGGFGFLACLLDIFRGQVPADTQGLAREDLAGILDLIPIGPIEQGP